MSEQHHAQIDTTLRAIANQLRGAMNADDFRDYMLCFLFLRSLSDSYEAAARHALGSEYPNEPVLPNKLPLQRWYNDNPDKIDVFETQMFRTVPYFIKPTYLWGSIAHLARTQDNGLLRTLQECFQYIENEAFASGPVLGN